MNIADLHRLPSLMPLSFHSPRASEITWQDPLDSEESQSAGTNAGTASADSSETSQEESGTSPLVAPSSQFSETFRNFLLQLQERGFFTGEGHDFVNGIDGAQVIGTDEADHIAVGSNAAVSAGKGDDTVYAWSGSSVDGGEGNDTLVSWTQGRLSGGEGDDRIDAWSDSWVDGGSGDDYLSAWSNSLVFGGDGNDDISVWSNSVVDGGEGDDVIAAWTGSTVDGGAGDDRISVREDSEVTGGTGDDSITISSGIVNYAAGDGNDTIRAEGKVTLKFGAGIEPESTHVAYDGDTATITFDGSDEKITVENGPGAQVRLAFSNGTSLAVAAGDDLIG
ncbi:hypothetical protein [Breoghania sp. JC706]|uniref:hypothetical protein n=1 Tax=Breoghania sp. JC706 TaxID=3117732 RepID=UPI003009D98D